MNIREKREREKPRNRLLTIENTLTVTEKEVGGGWVKQVINRTLTMMSTE